MKDTIITLTPPINEVQYGISDEPIKKGDVFLCPVGDLFEIKTAPVDMNNPEYRKLILSTNPKDTRFPYLQLVCPTCGKREWKFCSSSWHRNILPSKEQEVDVPFHKDSPAYSYYMRGFNANKGIYTQEQMIQAIAFGFGICRNHDRAPFNSEQKEFLQSLQPTAKAVRVEMEVDLHSLKSSITSKSTISISAFSNIKVETSSEHSQGIVRAIEVIY